jgi:hypothetical protein
MEVETIYGNYFLFIKYIYQVMALMGELVSHKTKTKIFYLEPPGVRNCYLKKIREQYRYRV